MSRTSSRGVRVASFGAIVACISLTLLVGPRIVGASQLTATPRARSAARTAAVAGGPAGAWRASHSVHLVPHASSPQYQLGYTPMQINGAYGIPYGTHFGPPISNVPAPTIAIVDWNDDPNAASDFEVFSRQFGLPTNAYGCGCFSKVNQTGGTTYPPTGDASAILETSLDIEWAHAIAPLAHILLVEANDNSIANLMAAEDYATAHAQVVSNSWGGPEFSGEASYDSHFDKPNVAITASSGDSGAPAQYPSASPFVFSVGGTSLTINGQSGVGGCVPAGCTYGGETVWSGGGGGPSAYESTPNYQVGYCGSTANVNACGGMRGTPDLAWDADHNPGVAVYDSFQGTDWTTAYGTDVGAPSVAGLIALADQAHHTVLTTNDLATRFDYENEAAPSVYGSTYHDVTSGSDGSPCCQAGTGYDLASGLGSPVGSQWIQTATVQPALTGASLQAVTAVSASDVWAVGYYSNTSNQPLIEQWNGSMWSLVPSANPPARSSYELNGLAAVSANDVWAVGTTNNLTTNYNQTLIEQWNGRTWNVVPSPNASSKYNSLFAVSAVSASNVWAAGYTSTSSGFPQTLIEQWNGSAWSIVPSPNASSGTEDILNSVAAVSASDVWAVGKYADSTTITWQTLIEQWNGSAWSIVPSPKLGSKDNALIGVAAVSASDAWAVGYNNNNNSGGTLIEQWNGSAWSAVRSPTFTTNGNMFNGVAAVSASDVWAVGVEYIGPPSPSDLTLIEQWNGSQWSIAPSPNPAGSINNYLQGVAAVSASDVWAVGNFYDTTTGVMQALIEQWNGSAWSIVPSP